MTKVAVYGTLKRGRGNDRLLGDAKFLGETLTTPEYTMYHLGAFPCITLEGDTPIHVEVYEVDSDTFKRLDMLEGYPSFYNRKKINTILGTAWIYYMTKPTWGTDMIVGGKW